MLWLGLRDRSDVAFIPLFVLALAITIWGTYFRRCPQCKRRLVFRKEDVCGTSLYRELYDCPHCHTIWDSGSIGDHEKDDRVGGDA